MEIDAFLQVGDKTDATLKENIFSYVWCNILLCSFAVELQPTHNVKAS